MGRGPARPQRSAGAARAAIWAPGWSRIWPRPRGSGRSSGARRSPARTSCAEVHRQLRGVRFASHTDRMAVAETCRCARARRVGDRLSAGASSRPRALPARGRDLEAAPRRPAAVHRPGACWTPSTGCLTPGAGSTAATVSRGTVAQCHGDELCLAATTRCGVDQALAVEQIATSGRVLDVLVGPAGTGKTTTLAGLRAVWEAEHGPGSVVGPRAVGGRRRGARRRAWDLRPRTPRSGCSSTSSTPRRRAEIDQLLDNAKRSRLTSGGAAARRAAAVPSSRVGAAQRTSW